jgi:hypothetical protein
MKYFIESLKEITIQAFNDEIPWEEVEAKEAEQEAELKKFYDALVSGRINYFYQKTKHHLIAWHKSTRENVLIQESHAVFLNGEFTPIRHANINSFAEMIKENGFLTDEYILTEGEKEE